MLEDISGFFQDSRQGGDSQGYSTASENCQVQSCAGKTAGEKYPIGTGTGNMEVSYPLEA